MSTLSDAEMAMFQTDAPEDDWGFDDAPKELPGKVTVKASGRVPFLIEDQSTRSDAEVKAERDRIATAVQANGGKIPPVGARMSDVDAAMAAALMDAAAQIIPPDAPANYADVPPPEKAKRGKKAAATAEPAVTFVGADAVRVLKDIAEIKALLLSLIAR